MEENAGERKICLGMTKLSEWERYEERDAVMRLQYINPIEGFSDKIDRLLEVIERVTNDFRLEKSIE